LNSLLSFESNHSIQIICSSMYAQTCSKTL
jgi:hypothetical protein